MAYNKESYNRVLEIYKTKYLLAETAADARKAEVEAKIPALREIDRALSATGMAIMRAAMEADDLETRIAEMHAENRTLQARRALLLVENGYPANYIEPQYECPLCHDTGFIETKMCQCMRRQLIEASYEPAGLVGQLAKQSFDNFDLSYYEYDPRVLDRMTRIYHKMKSYAETFVPGSSESMALFGGTGLGKTHLSSAVAKTVVGKGCDVLYVSAVGMLGDFERRRFGNATGSESGEDTTRYYECDLLIIDDLGTEVINQFTASILYDLINNRLLACRSTVISTNLSQEEFRTRYYDRITSRVFGEYLVLPFVGKDVRQQKQINRG